MRSWAFGVNSQQQHYDSEKVKYANVINQMWILFWRS
jgi:hypothetical protein